MSRDPEMFINPELIKQFKEGCYKVGHLVTITSVTLSAIYRMANDGREK